MKINIFSALILIVGCSQHTSSVKGLEGEVIPVVNLLLPDSSNLNTKSIPLGQPIVVFYFSTNCPYCRAQMTELTSSNTRLNNTHVYAMTLSNFSDFKSFCNEFKLTKYSNITAGLDYTGSIAKFFKLKSVPFTAIFNSQKKVTTTFTGRTSVKEIEQALIE